MNAPIRSHSKKLIVMAIASVLLVACSSAPKRPDGADAARAKLLQLQSDSQLASLAPVSIKAAEVAVNAAEQPQKDVELGKHLVFIADRKVDIATAQAQGIFLEAQRKTLSEQREKARLDSRTREADQAHSDAARANSDAASSKQQVSELQKQLDELNAKTTDRGVVVTLGDVLFDTGRSELKGGAVSNLAKLAAFLNQYQDRTVAIEGHTDNVGSEESNLGLSQRRADSVKSYLVHQGVGTLRLTSAGLGEDAPVASNESVAGRQQNRRVEVIIANPATAAK